MKKISSHMIVAVPLLVLIMLSVTAPHAAALTLKDCVQKALKTHPDIKRFILLIRHRQREVDASKADYLPQISLNAEYDPTRTYVIPANGIFQTKDSDGWQTGVAVKQKVWDFSRTTSLIKAGKTQAEIARLSLQDARALLAYKVKLQYELALVQQKSIAARQGDLRTKKELYKQAQALVEQGLKTRADAARFMSSSYAAQDNLAIAESNLSKAKTTLSLYIGAPIPAGVELTAAPTPSLAIDSKTAAGATSAVVAKILQNSPTLKGLRKNITRSGLLYKAAKAARYGSIDALASYTHQDTLNAYDSTLAGITLNVPLYSGGRLSAQEMQADIDRQSAINDYNAEALALRDEITGLLIDLRRYEHTIRAKSAQLTTARQTQDIVNGRYKEGLATYIEALDAAALTLDARLGVLQATYDKSSTLHRLAYLQGIIL